MDASQAQELRLQMEAQLLSDAAVKQAKIVNLADSPDSEPIWTAALALDASAAEEGGDAAVVGRARKALRKKMNELGHKALVPKNWTVLASLPLVPGSSNTDETVWDEALRAELLGLPPPVSSADESVADKIRRVVQFTLRKEPADMDMDKSFAQLGGDSITAIETMARCMESGIAFHVLDLLQCESLNALAEQVAAQEGNPPPGAGEIPQDDRTANMAMNPPPYVSAL